MTIARSTDNNTISVPAFLLQALSLREGDQVKAVVDGNVIRLARIDKFLALRGIYANDADFDEAMSSLEQHWQSWTIPPSA